MPLVLAVAGGAALAAPHADTAKRNGSDHVETVLTPEPVGYGAAYSVCVEANRAQAKAVA